MEGNSEDFRALAQEVLEEFGALGRRMGSRMQNARRGEHGVIHALACSASPLTPSELATLGHLSSARVANVLRALEEKGWITRSHDTQDRRRVTVTLTEQGEAERARRRAEFDRQGAKFLRELGDEDAREALRILKRCNEILSKQDPTETKGGDADENHQAL